MAALEILVSNYAVANLIRDGKTHQLPTIMMTQQARGNRLLNDDLFRLVNTKKISSEEALNNSIEKKELAAKLGIK